MNLKYDEKITSVPFRRDKRNLPATPHIRIYSLLVDSCRRVSDGGGDLRLGKEGKESVRKSSEMKKYFMQDFVFWVQGKNWGGWEMAFGLRLS